VWQAIVQGTAIALFRFFTVSCCCHTADLKMVGANRAASTVIVSDQSRNAAEADAQAVRHVYIKALGLLLCNCTCAIPAEAAHT
jgi:hypothetical protein